MYCLTEFCVVCLKKGEQYRIIYTNTDDAQLLHKLHTCTFVTDFLQTDASLSICNKCHDSLQIAYEFIDMCHKNSVVLRGYITQLSHASASTTHEIEFIASNDIKLEYEDECREQIVENPEPKLKLVSSDLMLNAVQLKEDKEEAIILKEVEQCIIKEEIHLLNEDFTSKDKQLSSMDDIGTIDDQEAVESINNQKPLLMDDAFSNIQCSKSKRIHNGEQGYQCTACEKRFTQIRYLKSHMLSHTGEKNYECGICAKRFTHVQNLKSHMLTHTGEKKYHCTICEKRFALSKNLKSHILTHTGKKKYQCTICENRFTHPQYLKSHMLTHTGEQKYQCSICKNRFGQSQHLKSHMLTHTGEKNYQCTICEKRFAQSSNLKTHIQTHTVEKEYVCTVCEKRFTCGANLKSHMVNHTGEKKYECTICKKRFTRSGHLKSHTLTHSEEKKFECTICEKRFKHSQNLKPHMLTHTGKKKI